MKTKTRRSVKLKALSRGLKEVIFKASNITPFWMKPRAMSILLLTSNRGKASLLRPATKAQLIQALIMETKHKHQWIIWLKLYLCRPIPIHCNQEEHQSMTWKTATRALKFLPKSARESFLQRDCRIPVSPESWGWRWRRMRDWRLVIWWIRLRSSLKVRRIRRMGIYLLKLINMRKR